MKKDYYFGETLRVYRQRSGLTQENLAERIGVNRAYIAMLETGQRRNLTSKKLANIIDTLDLSETETYQIISCLLEK